MTLNLGWWRMKVTLIKNKFLVASDFYLTPQQAIDYGVIDHILER